MARDLFPTDPGARAAHGRFADAAGGAFLLDAQGTLLGFDTRMEALTGWSAPDLVGRSVDRACCLEAPGGPVRMAPFLSERPEPTGGQDTCVLELRCADGSLVEVEASVSAPPAFPDRVRVQVLRVLARTSPTPDDPLAEELDELTGLTGPARFHRELDRAVRAARAAGRPLALILADVDHLRRVNDRYGARVGDAVLARLAGVLRAALPEEAPLARVGDDAFAVFLTGAGRGEARQVAARLRSTVERTRFPVAGGAERPVRITLSLGAASCPADADTASDLRRRAWEALEQARHFGRNRVWCYTRRPRVPLVVPVYYDSAQAPLAGVARDLSPSGLFVQTQAPVDIGMRCALSFPLPGAEGRVHVIGRVVRTVPPEDDAGEGRVPGMGVEFERFGPQDREAIERFLHRHEAASRRPETGRQSV